MARSKSKSGSKSKRSTAARSRSGRVARRDGKNPRGWLRPGARFSGAFASIRGDSTVRFMVVIAWIALLAGVGGAWAYSLPRLREYVVERKEGDAIAIGLPAFPAWLDVERTGERPLDDESRAELLRIKRRIIDEITMAARLELSGGVFAWEDLERARIALERTGWFRSLKRIERISASEVRVEGEYVTPFTMIQDTMGNHLVTRDARVLPLRYPRSHRMNRIPLIVGARFPRPAAHGEAWQGRDVDAGLRLAEYLLEEPWADQIAEIDVTEFVHTEALWIVSVHGTRILWGRVPGEERGLEVPARQKAAYLADLNRLRGRIGGGFSDLDITSDTAYGRPFQ